MLCHTFVSYVAAVAVEVLQSGVMLQASRQLWRPSSTLLSSRVGRRTVLGVSCSSSDFLLHSSGESTCISRITIPPHSGWAQERPSAVPWIIREAHTGTAGKSHGRRKKGLKDSYLQYTKRGDALQTSNAEDESEEMEEKASKGASKRRALRAKDWGAKLASLSANQLRQAVRLAKLPEEVYDAVILVKSLGPKVRNGKRRQFNYIGGLLREADPELMEQSLKVCIDGETSGSPSASTSAPESSEDEFSDDNNDEEIDDLSEEDLSAQNMARRWIAGLLGGYQDVTYEVFSCPSDVYFDRQELRRLLRAVNQAQASLLSIQTADSGETENSQMSPPPLEAAVDSGDESMQAPPSLEAAMDSGDESMQESPSLEAASLGDDKEAQKAADSGENEETQTSLSLETAEHEEIKKLQKSPKQLKKAAKKAETALFNFLFDLARRRILDSQYLEA